MIEFLNHWGRLWAEHFGMAVVQNPVSCESASALIRQKNELFNSLKYHMKVICLPN